jgi:hypothetical protein
MHNWGRSDISTSRLQLYKEGASHHLNRISSSTSFLFLVSLHTLSSSVCRRESTITFSHFTSTLTFEVDTVLHLQRYSSLSSITTTMAGGVPISTAPLSTGFLRGRALIYPLSLIISLFFLWGFSYGLLDVLNKHFQTVLGITKLQSTGLQVVYFGGGYLIFSPIAAEVMKRKGYKVTILMGLSLYSLGAIFFWPTAHFSTYEHRLASFGGMYQSLSYMFSILSSY